MSSESHNAELLGELESRSSRVEQQLWRLWIPGWRARLFNESYDIGYRSRHLGAMELAEKNLQRALTLLESRSSRVEQLLWLLWIPGWRLRLFKESYEVGYRSRQLGAIELAEKNLRRALALMDHRKLSRFQTSRQIFHIIAHCHNNLGIIYLDQERMTEANVEFDKAITLRLELQRLSSDDRENDVYLAGSLCNRGHATASTAPDAATEFYKQSLAMLRQPTQTCECSYWDEQRQSWWCEQLEAMGQALGLAWVELAPQFIDNAMRGLQLLETRRTETE